MKMLIKTNSWEMREGFDYTHEPRRKTKKIIFAI